MTQKELNPRQDGTLLFRGRVCLPQDSDLCHDILEEAHSSPFFLHPAKMYRTIRPGGKKGMKRDVAEYVAKCLVCQLVKAEHQRPTLTASSDKLISYTIAIRLIGYVPFLFYYRESYG